MYSMLKTYTTVALYCVPENSNTAKVSVVFEFSLKGAPVIENGWFAIVYFGNDICDFGMALLLSFEVS